MEYDIKSLLWDTAPLYAGPESAELEGDFGAAATEANVFRNRYRGRVAGMDAVELLQALTEYEQIEELIVKPQLYAHLLFAADSDDDVPSTISSSSLMYLRNLKIEKPAMRAMMPRPTTTNNSDVR